MTARARSWVVLFTALRLSLRFLQFRERQAANSNQHVRAS